MKANETACLEVTSVERGKYQLSGNPRNTTPLILVVPNGPKWPFQDQNSQVFPGKRRAIYQMDPISRIHPLSLGRPHTTHRSPPAPQNRTKIADKACFQRCFKSTFCKLRAIGQKHSPLSLSLSLSLSLYLSPCLSEGDDRLTGARKATPFIPTSLWTCLRANNIMSCFM